MLSALKSIKLLDKIFINNNNSNISSEILNNLNNLLLDLDEYYLINQGGCVFTCLCIIKHLKRLNIDYDVILYSDYDKSASYLLNNNIACFHCWLTINNKHINNPDNLDLKDYNHLFNLDPDKLENYYNKCSNGWNKTYDINFNTIIETKIDNFFINNLNNFLNL